MGEMRRTLSPTRAACLLAALWMAVGSACSPGNDGAWTVLDQGLSPAQLRAVRVDADGGVWAAGYHGGSLTGLLLYGDDQQFEGIPIPADLLWDFAFVEVCRVDDDALWLAATAHLFRLADGEWTVIPVPEEIVDGVTACEFDTDGGGLLVGQSWDGPRIYAFADGEFTEEPLAENLEEPDQISLAGVLSRGEFGYAAGVRRTDPQEAVLLVRREEGWQGVALPAGAADVGPIRDLEWHAGGPDIWAVGDLIIKGDAGSLEVAEFPYDDGFTPRVVAFPGNREGWVAGFGEEGVVHERFGTWEAVPPERLAPDLGEGLTRTWLFDDADFPKQRSGWLVAEYSDCDGEGECDSGQAILHYDRDASTVPWTVDGTWAEPPDEGEAAPAVEPFALATGPDGGQWLAGDADPDGAVPWGAPQLWQRPEDGDWSLESVPAGVGIRDIHFDAEGDGWAVGSRAGVYEGDATGVLLRLVDGAWIEETVDGLVASDWELYAVASAPGDTVYAVGRRHHFPLALARGIDAWQIIDVDDYEGITALRDVAVDGDGAIWAVGTVILGSGGTAGYLAIGDSAGLERQDLSGLGRECGTVDERAPCWSLQAVAAHGSDLIAVGEATVLTLAAGQIEATATNMTLLDVAYDPAGQPWILAENGWWEPDGASWTVQRHWDAQAGEGFTRRLARAAPDFSLVAGYRQRSNDEGGALLHAVIVRPGS